MSSRELFPSVQQKYWAVLMRFTLVSSQITSSNGVCSPTIDAVGHWLAKIFADDPTNGLDSTIALHLMDTLKDLAAGGRAIIMTVQQPSSRICSLFDKLLVLSGGQPLFYGKARLHEEIPPFVRPARFKFKFCPCWKLPWHYDTDLLAQSHRAG